MLSQGLHTNIQSCFICTEKLDREWRREKIRVDRPVVAGDGDLERLAERAQLMALQTAGGIRLHLGVLTRSVWGSGAPLPSQIP